jgi:hypothetical protein
MKEKILLTVSLAVIIALTVTGTTVSSNSAFAIENYLQLRSATVTENGDIDVDIRTGGNIPSEKGNSGFGYAVLTDVGDEFVNNVLVAITDIGLDDYDESKNDKLDTHVFDLTGDVSSDCSGSDFEVDKSSSDNEAFDTNYPIDIQGSEVSIDDVDTGDLAGDTVKAIASFTADAVTNNGKIQHICIDIQDVLKQSEISVSYDSENGDHDNDHDGDGKDDDKDKDTKDKDDDSSSIDIDQDIDQSNTCSGSSNCSNEGSNEANVGGGSSSSNSDLFGIDVDQAIDQSNTCSGEAACSNEGSNEANIWEDDSSDKTGIDIGQSIQQNNECDGEASCSNEGSNEANVLGYPSILNEEEFGSDIDIGQSIEQSNTCGGGASCSNQASNVANIG